MKIIILLLLPIFTFGQVNLPTVPQPNQIPNYSNQNYSNPNNRNIVPNPTNQYFDADKQRQQKQNEQIMREVEQNEKLQAETLKQAKQDIEEFRNHKNIDYNFKSLSNVKGTELYREVFDNMQTLNIENYSVKDVVFKIENAFTNNLQDKTEFDQIIKNSGEFLISKMNELNYDINSNTAKNFMLFQFFSETLQLKSNGIKHLPLKYDFEDYRGVKDYSKMFVTKLLRTQTGQCHSLPLLYLILAEEIRAEAYLSICPEHSYIKFQGENGKWYNVELTNAMFTSSTSILNSGFIKAEAMQNEIYMQNHTKPQLLSRLYSDLASGYIHKFGYDEFIEKVVNKSLEIYPQNITSQMIKSNYETERFKYVLQQIGVTPEKKQSIQLLEKYPEAIEVLEKRNEQYTTIDNLGFETMSPEQYQNWLLSLNLEKGKQESEKIKKQFKGLIIKKQLKN
jgi:hypothetical protein